MKLTRRNYERLAALLNRAMHLANAQNPPRRILDALTVDLAEWASAENAAFDNTKFFAAVYKGIPK